jgi:O-phosphoseryl-tRNA(Cys) synthetase
MITDPEWLKTKKKPYYHQISQHCIKKLVECLKKFNKGEIDADTSFEIERQLLADEIDDPEFLFFVIANFGELSSHIASGKINIRINRDITGEIWCVVYKKFR